MGAFAMEDAVQRVAVVAAGHHTDRHAPLLEQRVLLDMQLEIGIERPPADRCFAQIAYPPELVAITDAVIVLEVVQPIHGREPGEDARSCHRRSEPCAFLIGPVDHLDGTFRGNAVVVQRAQDLQARQHSQNAVEAPARRLGVEVAAHHDRRQAVVPSGAPGEDAARFIDRDPAAAGLAPGGELVAHLPVAVREGQPPQPALRSSPDRGRAVQRGPQAFGVDGKVGKQRRHRGAPAV